LSKIQSIIGVSDGRPENDFYSTPPDATRLLLNHESFDSKIWEPACGVGSISKVLKEYKYDVYSSDLIDRGFGIGGKNFFEYLKLPENCSTIITNPPFRIRSNGKEYRVEHWVEHGFQIGANKIALFLKTTAIAGKQRSFVFEKHLLKLLQFRDRVSLYRNDVPMKNKGMMDFAWFIFLKNPLTSPVIEWIPIK